jgi:hypothetical protein
MKVGLGGCIGNGCGWKDMQLAVSRCFVMHNLHLAAIRIESDPDRIAGQRPPGGVGSPRRADFNQNRGFSRKFRP